MQLEFSTFTFHWLFSSVFLKADLHLLRFFLQLLGKDLKIHYFLEEYVYMIVFLMNVCVRCDFITWLHVVLFLRYRQLFWEKSFYKRLKEYGIILRGFIGSGSALLPVWSSWPFRVKEEGFMNICIHGSFFLYPVQVPWTKINRKKKNHFR